MNVAANRFQRLALMLPHFAAQERQSISALARILGTTPDIVLGDLNALIGRFDDVPGYEDPIAVSIEGDSVTLSTDHFLRPMRVTGAELCALELGLGLLARECSEEQHATIASLRAKLARCITGLPHDAAYAGLRDGTMTNKEQGRILEAIRAALRRSRAVQIDYLRPSDADAGQRKIRPYALFFHHGAWYVGGHCERANGMRLFRVDRIVECAATDDTFEVPRDFALDDLMAEGRPFTAAAPPARFRVRYSAAIARWIAERDGQPVESGGSAVRELPLADREWAVRHVLQYGPDCQVLSPDDLREEIVERLRGMGGGPARE